MGEQAVSIHAAGDAVYLQREDGTREPVALEPPVSEPVPDPVSRGVLMDEVDPLEADASAGDDAADGESVAAAPEVWAVEAEGGVSPAIVQRTGVAPAASGSASIADADADAAPWQTGKESGIAGVDAVVPSSEVVGPATVPPQPALVAHAVDAAVPAAVLGSAAIPAMPAADATASPDGPTTPSTPSAWPPPAAKDAASPLAEGAAQEGGVA